jgi:hypothetical protein
MPQFQVKFLFLSKAMQVVFSPMDFNAGAAEEFAQRK